MPAIACCPNRRALATHQLGQIACQPRCLADETGGLFVKTDTVDELIDALQQTLGCPVIGKSTHRNRRQTG